MKEITKQQAQESKLKLVGRVCGKDMSKIILLIERLKEKNIKYYMVESIIYDQNTQDGEICISFWKDI